MLINSVSNNPNLYTKRKNQNNQLSFTAANPEVLKNQFRILLTQDIYAPSLKVKMPDTPLEKEVLLEILQNRLKLDRLTRLTNENVRLKTLIGYIKRLRAENPLHPDLPGLEETLSKKGNIASYLRTLQKSIDIEASRKKPVLDYFRAIEKLEDEYLEKHLIRTGTMDKFWHKIDKNNINPDGKLSTQEIIDIISKEQSSVSAKAAAQQMSKKQLLSTIQNQYEQFLRENVDVYKGESNHNHVARSARQMILKEYAGLINKFQGSDKQITKIFESVEEKYTFKVDRLEGIDIYPIGEIWKDMKADENSIRGLMGEINSLRQQLSKTPNSTKVKNLIKAKETELEKLKKDWLTRLKYSVKYEAINRQRMIDADRLPEYEYLTAENKTIKRHKQVFNAYVKNNKSIPEDLWTTVIAG